MQEPMTVLTDYLLTLCVGWWGWQLLRSSRADRQLSRLLWGKALLAAALAAFTGGTVHGFAVQLGERGALLLWKVTVLATGLGSLFLLAAVILAGFRGRLRRWLLAGALLKFLLYAAWMTVHNEFIYVILDYAPALLAILGLQLWAWGRHRSAAAPWLLAGIALAFVGAGIQASGLGLHRHFNHNDLFHLVQLAAFYLWYRGGLLLCDRAQPQGGGTGSAGVNGTP